MRLNKRRGRGGAGGVSSAVSKLVVKNREPTENEIRLQVITLNHPNFLFYLYISWYIWVKNWNNIYHFYQNARLVQLENVAQEEDDDEADDSDADEPKSAKNADQTENTDQGEKTNEEDKESDSADDLFGSSSGEDDE